MRTTWWGILSRRAVCSEHPHPIYVTYMIFLALLFNFSNLILSPQFSINCGYSLCLTLLMCSSQWPVHSKFSANGPGKMCHFCACAPVGCLSMGWLAPQVWHPSPVPGQAGGCVLWATCQSGPVKMPIVAANYYWVMGLFVQSIGYCPHTQRQSQFYGIL